MARLREGAGVPSAVSEFWMDSRAVSNRELVTNRNSRPAGELTRELWRMPRRS